MCRPYVHGQLQAIRGMCSDAAPHTAIDAALSIAVERVKDLEDERDMFAARDAANPLAD